MIGAFLKRQLDRIARHTAKRKAKRKARCEAVVRFRRGYRGQAPSGTSWRQLKRAVARGYAPMQPSIHARLRHKWFQKATFNAGLRIKLGQEQPGDRKLFNAVGLVIRSAHARQNLQGAAA